MGFVDDMFSQDQGIGWKPNTEILKTATEQQIKDAYDRAQSGLDQQQQFLQALQAQNGIQNQSDVFAQQQAFAQQLQDQANGVGPNPAQIALENATGQNIAQQAALMGSQRGTSSNAGLIARQAAQQGAGIQQQAVGQSALMQAQQQLAARQQLQQQQAMMAGLSGQQVGQQAAATMGMNQAAQSEQGILTGAASNLNTVNANLSGQEGQIAQLNAKNQMDMFGGAMKGAAMAVAYNGGVVKNGTVQNYADGGAVDDKPGKSFANKFLSGWAGDEAVGSPYQGSGPASAESQNGKVYDGSQAAGKAIGGGLKNLISSLGGSGTEAGGGGGFDTTMVAEAAHGGQIKNLKPGGHVPGKASVPGNSIKNDTVPAILSPGEIVIPRTHANDPEKAKAFVAAILARKRMRK